MLVVGKESAKKKVRRESAKRLETREEQFFEVARQQLGRRSFLCPPLPPWVGKRKRIRRKEMEKIKETPWKGTPSFLFLSRTSHIPAGPALRAPSCLDVLGISAVVGSCRPFLPTGRGLSFRCVSGGALDVWSGLRRPTCMGGIRRPTCTSGWSGLADQIFALGRFVTCSGGGR